MLPHIAHKNVSICWPEYAPSTTSSINVRVLDLYSASMLIDFARAQPHSDGMGDTFLVGLFMVMIASSGDATRRGSGVVHASRAGSRRELGSARLPHALEGTVQSTRHLPHEVNYNAGKLGIFLDSHLRKSHSFSLIHNHHKHHRCVSTHCLLPNLNVTEQAVVNGSAFILVGSETRNAKESVDGR